MRVTIEKEVGFPLSSFWEARTANTKPLGCYLRFCVVVVSRSLHVSQRGCSGIRNGRADLSQGPAGDVDLKARHAART